MELKEALAEIYKAAHKEFNFENVPSLHLRQDEENAQGIFWKNSVLRSIGYGCCALYYRSSSKRHL